MSAFDAEVLAAAAGEKEVRLKTYGRKTGKEHQVTIWIVSDGERIFIRSGQGLKRHWPQNLLARNEGELQLGTLRVKVKPRRVTEPPEARAASSLYTRKYGSSVKASKPDEPLTQGEQATFELISAG